MSISAVGVVGFIAPIKEVKTLMMHRNQSATMVDPLRLNFMLSWRYLQALPYFDVGTFQTVFSCQNNIKSRLMFIMSSMTHSVNHQKQIRHFGDAKKAEKYQNQQIFNLITCANYATIDIQIAFNGFIKFREFLSPARCFVSEAASNYVRTRESYLIEST
jgi:hypothetical protein